MWNKISKKIIEKHLIYKTITVIVFFISAIVLILFGTVFIFGTPLSGV